MPKQYFTIKVEGVVPIEVSYRIFAESEKQALNIMERSFPKDNILDPPRIKWGLLRRTAAKVYYYGTTLLLKSKRYQG